MQEVKQYGGWIIENIMDSTLFWSRENGWTKTRFDTFTDEDREAFVKPREGDWTFVPWAIY